MSALVTMHIRPRVPRQRDRRYAFSALNDAIPMPKPTTLCGARATTYDVGYGDARARAVREMPELCGACLTAWVVS